MRDRHYEARIKDLEVSLFQQRNLNNELERMLRDLIGKFKKQKRHIRRGHEREKHDLLMSINAAEETIRAVDRKADQPARDRTGAAAHRTATAATGGDPSDRS